MRFNHALLLVPCALLTLAVGCSNDKPGDTNAADTTASTMPKEVTIVKGVPAKDPGDVKFTIVSPKPNEVVTTDSVTVKANLSGYDLASPTEGEGSKGIAYSKEGQHIHVIIDDKPYMAMYKPEGFSVGALSEGVHTLRAFPSRSWHESIKKPSGVFVAETFYVKKKSGDPVLKEGVPLLTYSRPKGEYKPEDAKQILLDFYVSNAELGPDKYKVVASVDGAVKDTLTEWIPYFIEGLTPGTHTVKLELIGPDGKAVENGPFNSVEREITVKGEETAAAR